MPVHPYALVPLLLLGSFGIAHARPVREIDQAHQMCTVYNSTSPLSRVVVSLPLEMVTIRDAASIVLVTHERDVTVSRGEIDLDPETRGMFIDVARQANLRCIHDQDAQPRRPILPDDVPDDVRP